MMGLNYLSQHNKMHLEFNSLKCNKLPVDYNKHE